MTRRQSNMKEAIAAAMQAAKENSLSDKLYGSKAGEPPFAPWPKEPTPLVFLDFDGVLNTAHSRAHLGTKYGLSPDSIQLLNEIQQESGALIVITSSWRKHWTLRENILALEKSGCTAGNVVGRTSTAGKNRGRQVDSWLKNVPFPVSSFVILDDRSDMATHKDHLVQINPETGLQRPDVASALQILAIPCPFPQEANESMQADAESRR